MCACNGTGVIQNDIGMGMYQFGACVCEAANQMPEEVDRKRHTVIARLMEIHQLQLEGKWNGNSISTRSDEGIPA
ncbi:hypothetical protein JDS76_26240 [Bacillus cereus]|uniref:hypothetical protein n=1 Tax=Bacillus cereus group TaxID=86661 RepID=UPI000BED35F2|nr:MULTISPECIES: hypothetical protein [Bacillus cereus group]MBJ8090291.1 hypothetical protein [Bacillus cereus]PDZ92535.1 hypothetical protein CON47_06125 [Bacillus thuringiensis]